VTRILAAAALALASVGCLHTQYVPPPCARADLTGCIVEGVKVTGNHQLSSSDITDQIATAESNHPLGGGFERMPIFSLWDRLLVDYETLDPFVLERDLARVERVYRARGYYEAHARAARVTKDGRGRIHVEIVVDEGAPVIVTQVRIVWNEQGGGGVIASLLGAALAAGGDGFAALGATGVAATVVGPLVPALSPPPQKVEASAKDALSVIATGQPLVESAFEGVKPKLLRAMTDHGFAYGKVDAKADVDLVHHTAQVTYTADRGPPTVFGAITLDPAGVFGLPEDRLRHIMSIPEGAPYSTRRLDKAQAAFSSLRVFGSVDAVPQLRSMAPPDANGNVPVPVTFRFTPTLLRTLKLGFGVEAGTRVDVHGTASWENRNFFGGLRSFTIEARPGIVFFPYTLTSLFSGSSEANFAVVPELRVHTALAQPGFVEALTRGTVSVDVSAYQLQPTATLGYLEGQVKLGLDRGFWDDRVKVTLLANMQVDQPLKLQLPGLALEPCAGGYNFLVLPYTQASGTLDYRFNEEGKRDSINPHEGFYLTNDVQLAVGPSANSSTDIKVRPDLRGYIPVSKHMTLALRFAGGILHPFGGDLTKSPYPANVVYSPNLAPFDLNQPDQCKILASFVPKGDVLRGSYIQLLQLRGFQSGGTNSNRGYAYSGIGPQEQVQGISPLSATNTLLPIATGGLALWEASVELRFPVYKQLGSALFVDASDVRNSLAEFAEVFAPHLSTGLGIRYQTPVGALRADFAVRVPGAQVIGSTCQAFDPTAAPTASQIWKPGKPAPSGSCYLDPSFGQAGSLAGVPLLISLAIGEAF
jgi:outer membrane protein assembly factor BamA